MVYIQFSFFSRTSLASMAGISAGILGLTALKGFIFYFIASLFMSVSYFSVRTFDGQTPEFYSNLARSLLCSGTGTVFVVKFSIVVFYLLLGLMFSSKNRACLLCLVAIASCSYLMWYLISISIQKVVKFAFLMIVFHSTPQFSLNVFMKMHLLFSSACETNKLPSGPDTTTTSQNWISTGLWLVDYH